MLEISCRGSYVALALYWQLCGGVIKSQRDKNQQASKNKVSIYSWLQLYDIDSKLNQTHTESMEVDEDLNQHLDL